MSTDPRDSAAPTRRWVIQEFDETGQLVDARVLTERQTQLALAAVAAEGHGVALAPRVLLNRFSPPELEFLQKHYFTLVNTGVFNGAYWFDSADAAAWRAAFDRFVPHLLEMAFAIYSPNPPWPLQQVRFGWESIYTQGESRSNFETLLATAEALKQHGGCFISSDSDGRRQNYYQEEPEAAERTAEATAGRRVLWWDAESGSAAAR